MPGKKKKGRPLIRVLHFTTIRIRAETEAQARRRLGEVIKDMVEDRFESFSFLQWETLVDKKFGVTGEWWSPDYRRDVVEGTLKWSNRREGGKWVFTRGRKKQFAYSTAPVQAKVSVRTEKWKGERRKRKVKRDRWGQFA
jgi:hypothetical protein